MLPHGAMALTLQSSLHSEEQPFKPWCFSGRGGSGTTEVQEVTGPGGMDGGWLSRGHRHHGIPWNPGAEWVSCGPCVASHCKLHENNTHLFSYSSRGMESKISLMGIRSGGSRAGSFWRPQGQGEHPSLACPASGSTASPGSQPFCLQLVV